MKHKLAHLEPIIEVNRKFSKVIKAREITTMLNILRTKNADCIVLANPS